MRPGAPPTGWWLALEPLGQDDVVWALSSTAASGGPVAAGLLSGMAELRALAANLLPVADGAAGDRTAAWKALWSGSLGARASETKVAVALGQALLPLELRDALRGSGRRDSVVTIAVRGWLAELPWPALSLDPTGDVRLVELATVLGGLSPSLAVGLPPRVAAPAMGHPLLLIDPGPAAGSAVPLYLPSQRRALWRPVADGLARAVGASVRDVLFPDVEVSVTADVLADLLQRKQLTSLVYVGHVHAGDGRSPASARLVLADDDDDDERLTAYRWLAEPERWPAPAHVALVACGSDDTNVAEQSGLPIAALNAGADLVTATRWTLPADGSHEGDGHEGDRPELPFTTLALAVGTAHTSGSPVDALRSWQLAQLAAWRTSGRRSASPLLWSSLVTYSAAAQGIRPAEQDA